MTKQSLKKPKDTKKTQFPKIYRIITENWIWSAVLSILILVGIVFSSITLYETYREKEQIAIKKKELSREISYWEDVAAKYKGYRDAYFKLSVLKYQIKDLEKSKEYLKKTLSIDPNFEPGLKLQKTLGDN